MNGQIAGNLYTESVYADEEVEPETHDMRRSIEQTAIALRSAALRAGMAVSGDDRVSEKDAATLLCYSRGYLKAMRLSSNGPVHFSYGPKSKVSYRVEHLAAWIEMGKRV